MSVISRHSLRVSPSVNGPTGSHSEITGRMDEGALNLKQDADDLIMSPLQARELAASILDLLDLENF